MGTHPIFESDFDCLTDMSHPVNEKVPPPYSEYPQTTTAPMSGFAPPPGQQPVAPQYQPVAPQYQHVPGHPLPGQQPVLVQPVVYTAPLQFGRNPVPTLCCHCNQSVTTEVSYAHGL